MKQVSRSDILDYVTYNEQRNLIRPDALIQKELRRIHLGDHLTFLFESTLTARYQIQEMIRIEKIVKESSIQHELRTYNSLLGDSGELGCTLLIEYTNESERDKMLKELLNLPKHLFLEDTSGVRSYAKFDSSQVGKERVSSVQFLKFSCAASPEKIGCDHKSMPLTLELSESQRDTLRKDLGL